MLELRTDLRHLPPPQFHKQSGNPQEAILKVAYKGQDEDRRLFHPGFGSYLNRMPVLIDTDPLLGLNVQTSTGVMQLAAIALSHEPWVIYGRKPGPNGFQRTIIAIEDTKKKKEGVEIVVAKWGDGFASPPHGHSPGFIHEELISGKMKITNYRKVEPESKVVRVLQTFIVEGAGIIASAYNPATAEDVFPREKMIHSFTSVGDSVSVHYVPEHTRDGRDNTFEVEHFEDVVKLTQMDVERINSQEGMALRPGDVVLIRSTSVAEIGDHFMVITGGPVMKAHGMRPKEVTIETKTNGLLSQYDLKTGLILLKLKPYARAIFHEFHGITVDRDKVSFAGPILNCSLQKEINNG